MLGIKNIASYIPSGRESNLIPEKIETFGTSEEFVLKKIGVRERSIRGEREDTSGLACKALEQLMKKTGLSPLEIQTLIVVTQNPDSNLPHVSAIVHGLAGLDEQCAAFDVGLGCSGYVYGLSIISSFMAANGHTKGVLITADPYSKIVDPDDKNTALLFGDAATATYITQDPEFSVGPFDFGTIGKQHDALECRGGKLRMNGRAVFNFVATYIPQAINRMLERGPCSKGDIDAYLFHQGSRYIVETIASRLAIPLDRVRFGLEYTGNTVSSSIPLLLEQEFSSVNSQNIILSGFGVGLSYGNCLCQRVKK
jgi:3-oxoacyl-[acyl-carrier-protein] synthase-3